MAGTTKWASLSNDIVFEARQSPSEMTYVPNVAHFVEQPLLVGKSRMQKIGINLQEIKTTIQLHAYIAPIYSMKDKIYVAAINGEVLQWIWGNGQALGDFVITDIQEKFKKTDETGVIICQEMQLTLKEYAGPGVAEQTGIDAKKKAFANKAIDAPPTLSGQVSSVNAVSKNAQVVKVQNVALQKNLTAFQKAKKSYNAFKKDALPMLNKMKDAVTQINAAVAIAKNIKNGNSISSAASLVGVAANSMSIAMGGNPTVTQIASLSETVSNTAGGLDSVSAGANTVKSWFASEGF